MIPGLVTAAYIVYLAAPILLLIIGSFGARWTSTLLPAGFTTGWYAQLAADPSTHLRPQHGADGQRQHDPPVDLGGEHEDDPGDRVRDHHQDVFDRRILHDGVAIEVLVFEPLTVVTRVLLAEAIRALDR